MFFGIFSSIIPYLIAAGFYLVWVLFSFVQPYFKKDISSIEKNPSEAKVIHHVSLNKEEADADTCHFEDFAQKQIVKIIAIAVPPTLFHEQPDILTSYPPGRNFSFPYEILSADLYSRPPPAC